MRITGSKLRRIIRKILSESQGDDQMSQLVALENEWWDWCSGGNADSYAMGEMANIEDQINDLKSQMGLPIHDHAYGWAYGDGSPPIHPTDLRKQKMNEGRILSEGPGDGLNDPQVEEAYYELQNMSRDDFAVDTDFSFLDEWPYSEARDILADEEAAEHEEYEEDTDEARYSEMEDAVRARQGRLNVDDVYDGFQNRGMYEMKHRLMREFGEDDAQLRKKLQNRDKMIGRGIDGGTIGYDPNHDYDKRPSSRTPKFRAGDVLAQVGHVMEDLANSDAMMEHFEWKPSRNPDVGHIVSGGMTVVVKNNRGEFTFKMQKPHAWLGWERTCDSVDSQIEDILYDLQDYIDEKENS